MRTIKQNSPATIVFLMVSSTDHVTPATGLSPVVTLSKNGGTGGTATNSPASQVDAANAPGWYKIALTSTETNGVGDLIVHAAATGADPADRLLTVEALTAGDLGRKSIADVVGALSTYHTATVVDNNSMENRLIYSFLFSTGWVKGSEIAVTNRLSGDPFGTSFAAKLAETATTGWFSLYQETPLPYGTPYTISVYAKAAERSYVYLAFGANPENAAVSFDLTNGVVGTAQLNVTAYNIESAGNGWWRCWATATTPYGSGVCQIGVSANSGMTSYAGTAGSGVLIYGAQLETGSVPSSYHPTADASLVNDYGLSDIHSNLASVAQGLYAAIPSAVWEEPAANHTVSGSLGERLQSIIYSGGGASIGHISSAASSLIASKIWTYTSRTMSAAAESALISTLVTRILDTPLSQEYPGYHAQPTLKQAIYALLQLATEKQIVDRTVTVRQLDGTTPAMTFELDNATDPKAITRVS